MSCGFSWCLSLRKAKCELKRVTEVCMGTCGGWGLGGLTWVETILPRLLSRRGDGNGTSHDSKVGFCDPDP